MQINAKPRLKKLFRLRTILLMVILTVLLLPLGSLYFFRFYENELVRKTEIELITQSAAFAAVYRELIGENDIEVNGQYTPVLPQLDLAKDPVLPRRPQARLSTSYNQTPGYAIAQQAGRAMQKILLNTQKVTLAGMRILDANGIVVAGRGELNQSLAHVTEVKRALEGEYTAVLRERISDQPPPSIASISRGTGIRVFTAFPIINKGQVYGVVYLSRTPQNILKHLYGIKEKVILLSLLLLGLTGLIVLFLSSRLSRPIRELIEQTQKVTHGEIDTVEVLHKPGTYELAELSHSFSEMSKALQERSHYIQQFASHVSHEFKTPLTSMQGSLELLQEHDMTDEQHRRFINNLQADTQRLKQLVNRLLEQARADAMQSTREVCQLSTELEKLTGYYQELGLDIDLKNTNLASDLKLRIAAGTLQSVMHNLCDNALQHGATAMQINLELQDKQVDIAFHDNGSGISEANQDKIFTPFFTTRRETGGTGLGLGIIESLLKASGGFIRLEQTKKGALFIVTLDVAE